MGTSIYQGRRVAVDPASSKGILWIEKEQMPTEFLGGVLIAESAGGEPFSIWGRWGVGSITFRERWTSEDGSRITALLPACDAFFLSAFNPNGVEVSVAALVSRDVRYWTGMSLPGVPGTALAGGLEPSPGVLESGVASALGSTTGDEPTFARELGAALSAVVASGDEPTFASELGAASLAVLVTGAEPVFSSELGSASLSPP